MSAEEEREARLERKLAGLPKGPGVYQFKDPKGRVIYVGKAKNLRARVRSYFRQPDDGRVFYPFLLRRTADFEVLETANETEAFILENNLIKRFKPRYNVKLVDDKTFVSLRVNTRHKFPRIQVVRRPRRDKAAYFGPYSSASAVRKTLRIIGLFYKLRTCSDAELNNRSRPCLEHQIGRCTAPCVGLVDGEQYGAQVQGVLDFLGGKDEALIGDLEQKMGAAAEALEFETAARIRDQIAAVRKTLVPQKVQRHHKGDRDVFGLARTAGQACVQALFVRDGKLISAKSFSFVSELSAADLWGGFLSQFYVVQGNYPVREIVVPVEPDDAEQLLAFMGKRRGGPVKLTVPKRGEKYELLQMAVSNARRVLEHGEEQRVERRKLLAALQARIGLARLPWTIECFDNSHLMGTSAVASQVRFEGGLPDKSGYRRYKIKDARSDDDFGMMEEVMRRRVKAALKTDDLPDLFLVDGGKGQLGKALQVVREAGLEEEVMLASIAKARSARGSEERIFLPGDKDPRVLPRGTPERHLVERIRDEAHRFAIEYHRELRKRQNMTSLLDAIPGVGPKRKKALLKTLGSLKKVRAASMAELAAVPGISTKLAGEIKAYLEMEG